MGKIYQVIVVGIRGDKKTVDVGQSEEEMNSLTILEFKKKLIGKMLLNADPDELRLIFADRQMEDSDKFSDHHIKDKSTIFVVLKLPGGC
ncbi:uncharacterized protein LOC136771638 [Amia ocellicauda]|uniref:uncharacterized protein LOC136771638 n=1 Tax=Amia ocellicauda TaxID=2972642 RepID=UPI003464834D|nr:UBB protein [Amia calva]